MSDVYFQFMLAHIPCPTALQSSCEFQPHEKQTIMFQRHCIPKSFLENLCLNTEEKA